MSKLTKQRIRRVDAMKSRFGVLAVLLLLAAGCAGEPLDLAEFPPDGVLDCSDDSSWLIDGSPDPDVVGFATASEALADWLQPSLDENDDLRGPEQIDETTASLLNSQNREVVVAGAFELTPGNWVAISLTGCSGFERF